MMFRMRGEVFKFFGISLQIVEFFEAIGILDVTVAIVRQSVRRGLGLHLLVEDKGSERRARAGFGWIFELRDQRGSGALFWNGQSGKFAKSRIEIGKSGGLDCFGAIFGDAGCVNEEWGIGSLVPEGEFLPVGFFADVKSVVGPENHDSVFFHWRRLQSIEESPELIIHIADAGEIALHEVFPLLVVSDPFVPGNAVGWPGVGEVVFDVGWKLDFVERVEVEVFLRHFERNVRTEQPDGDELWLGWFGFEFFNGPIDDQMVAV